MSLFGVHIVFGSRGWTSGLHSWINHTHRRLLMCERSHHRLEQRGFRDQSRHSPGDASRPAAYGTVKVTVPVGVSVMAACVTYPRL